MADSRDAFHKPPFSIDVLRPSSGGDGSPLPPLESLLPGVFRDESVSRLAVPSLTPAYLTAELGLGRLDGFGHHWFWLLGSPALPRPLHDCCHRGRTICVTERMDRHLGLGSSGGGNRRDVLHLKPLPRLLLDVRFWQEVLACDCLGSGSRDSRDSSAQDEQHQQPCAKRHLWQCALGFLYSYAALLPYESDFRIAHDHGLLPPEVTWDRWRILAREVATGPDVVARRFHQRFHYGELRLHRLREVSQLRRGGLLPVLVGRLNRFARFFQNNVRWLASLVAYIAIVLSALQTGLTTTTLAASDAFQTFSTGFTMFALVGPLAILLFFSLYFGLSLLYHVSVHVITNHLFTTSNVNGRLEGLDPFPHRGCKSEV